MEVTFTGCFSSSDPKLAKKECVFIIRRPAGSCPSWGLYLSTALSNWAFLAALLLSILLSVILFVRVIETGYVFQASHASHTLGPRYGAIVNEAPLSMLVPAMAVAAAIILIGLYNQATVSEIISIKQEGGNKKEDPDTVLEDS